MAKKKMGLLLMAYGTPRNLDEVEAYYTHIRQGRKPPEELLHDLISRYEAVGGITSFAQITDEQVRGLEAACNDLYPDIEFHAYLGLKHITPFIEDAVTKMHEDGITEAISLVLAPHYSTYSVKVYNERACQHAQSIGGPTIHSVNSWYQEPSFINYWVKQIKRTLDGIAQPEWEKTVVIFSAHSLPEKILQISDPYPDQLAETAKLIAEAANVKHYAIGWQSAGNTPEPWIGPDVQDLTRELHSQKGYTSYVYCPVGFVAEHLEVLYDNDFECKVVTDQLGAHYYRPEMPNTKPEFINCLADVVAKKLKEIGSDRT